MVKNGVKFTPENLLRVEKMPNGKVVFLEKGKGGKGGSGFAHIIERHATDFRNKGISENEIANVVMKAVSSGKVVGSNGSAPVYEIMHRGVKQYISVGVGSNGYIVRANPVSTWSPLK